MYHMMQAWIFGIYCGWLHSLHVQIKACALRIGLLQVHVLHNLVPMFFIQVLPRTYATQIFVFPTALMYVIVRYLQLQSCVDMLVVLVLKI